MAKTATSKTRQDSLSSATQTSAMSRLIVLDRGVNTALVRLSAEEATRLVHTRSRYRHRRKEKTAILKPVQRKHRAAISRRVLSIALVIGEDGAAVTRSVAVVNAFESTRSEQMHATVGRAAPPRAEQHRCKNVTPISALHPVPTQHVCTAAVRHLSFKANCRNISSASANQAGRESPVMHNSRVTRSTAKACIGNGALHRTSVGYVQVTSAILVSSARESRAHSSLLCNML